MLTKAGLHVLDVDRHNPQLPPNRWHDVADHGFVDGAVREESGRDAMVRMGSTLSPQRARMRSFMILQLSRGLPISTQNVKKNWRPLCENASSRLERLLCGRWGWGVH